MPLAAAKSARSIPARSLFYAGRIGRLLTRSIDRGDRFLRALERTLRGEHGDHLGDRIDRGTFQESAPYAAGRRKTERVRVDDAARWNVQHVAEPQYHASPAVMQRSIGFVDERPGSRLAHAARRIANAERAAAENREIEIATRVPQRAAFARAPSRNRDPERGQEAPRIDAAKPVG